MVDGRLIARLDDARVSFCLIGDRARAVHGCAPRSTDVELLTLDETIQTMGRHQVGRKLDDADVRHIKAFLITLTGQYPDGTPVCEEH